MLTDDNQSFRLLLNPFQLHEIQQLLIEKYLFEVSADASCK